MDYHVGHFPARIMTPLERAADLSGLPPGEEAFVWSAEISSDRLDAYFTHMAESTLRNFAHDAARGVTFLDSHNNRQLGYGQSLAGIVEIGGGLSRVVADFYTVPGIRFGSGLSYESTDDFIKAVKARLVRDVSVGFYGGDMICDICGGSFWDFRACNHWPGVEYAIGDQGAETRIATFEIIEAHLAEVSAVYDGATPEAMILRANNLAEAGEIEPGIARQLEIKYRIKLPGHRIYPVKSVERSNTTMDELETIRAIAGEAGAGAELETVEAVRWLAGEVARLKSLADDGAAYRADLIEQAITEGVRVHGNAFPVETYRGMLGQASLDQIKQVRDTLGKIAAEKFSGGRQTVDEPEPPEVKKVKIVPDAAFAA